MKYTFGATILGCLLFVVACMSLQANTPMAPIQEPVLVPATQIDVQGPPPPARILLIGSLFSQDIDIFLEGLVHAANPTAELEVAGIILPAT